MTNRPPPCLIDRVEHHNRRWATAWAWALPAFFERVRRTTRPELLVIACCNHRVLLPQALGLRSGQAFVHRNVANLVSEHDAGIQATLRFGVEELGIREVLVCGHEGCDGVRAVLDGEVPDGPLEQWLQPVEELVRLNASTLYDLGRSARLARLVELNVRAQCEQVRALTRGAARPPMVHGCVYGLGDGRLRRLGPAAAEPLDAVAVG